MSKQLDVWEVLSDNYIQLWYGRLNAVYARGKLEKSLDEVPMLRGYEHSRVIKYDSDRPNPAELAYLLEMRDISLYLYRMGKKFLYLFKHDPTISIILSRDEDGNAIYEGFSLHTPENMAAFEDITARIGWVDRKATARFCNSERRAFRSRANHYETYARKKTRATNLSRSQYWNAQIYHDFLVRGEGDFDFEATARKISRKIGIPLRTARNFFPKELLEK